MATNAWFWIVFMAVTIAFLALDLGVFHRKARRVGMRHAAVWSTVWILVALLFNLGIYGLAGEGPALEFFTAYLIERFLSIDNLFVFSLIFTYFRVPAAYQHRLLLWGVIGAVVMRFVMIVSGVALLERFHWMIYIFGGFLVVTAVRMMFQDTSSDPGRNLAVRQVRRLIPITESYHGSRFFVRHQGRLVATPLLVALIAIEASDLVFAIDSIPAAFAVTRDAFILFTSNVFAVLGLRAMYFLLAAMLERFHYLRYGLGLMLSFVGVKMLLSDVYVIPIGISLSVVAGILALAVVASLRSRAPRQTSISREPGRAAER